MITKNPKNILIADDSLFFRTRLSDILTEAGHTVSMAGDGSDAISMIKEGQARIDLLILDLQMPHVDGFGVLKWMNENGFREKFPVLAVTGVYESSRVMERLRESGAAGLVTKGSTPEQLVFRVNRLIFSEKSPGAGPRKRVPVSIPVDFSLGDRTLTGFFLNLSETGAFLHTKADLLIGAILHLRFRVPGAGRILDIRGAVQWSTSEVSSKTLFGGYGIMFDQVPEADRGGLMRFINDETARLGLD